MIHAYAYASQHGMAHYSQSYANRLRTPARSIISGGFALVASYLLTFSLRSCLVNLFHPAFSQLLGRDSRVDPLFLTSFLCCSISILFLRHLA